MTEPTSVLSGVTVDLTSVGPNVTAGIGIYLPYFAIAAGLVIAGIVLTKGLGFLGRAGGARK